MEKAKITFLGTSSAVPTKKRSHTAILLNYKNESILVDCGEGTQRQFRLANLSPAKLTKIIITHWHGDHTLGLPGLFQTLSTIGYSKTLEIYGPKGTNRYISLLHDMFKVEIKLEVHEVSGKFLETEDFFLEAFPMKHGPPSLAYSFVIKDRRKLFKDKLKKFNLPNSPILKQLQQGKSIKYKEKTISPNQVSKIEKGKKITIILDTLPNPNTEKIAKNSDLLICEASFSKNEAQKANKYRHLTSIDAASIAKKAKAKKLILTHL